MLLFIAPLDLDNLENKLKLVLMYKLLGWQNNKAATPKNIYLQTNGQTRREFKL